MFINEISKLCESILPTSRLSLDDWLYGFTLLVSLRSTCAKVKQGAVLVSKDNRILSTGYNGPRSKDINCTDFKTQEEAFHFCGKNENNSCAKAIHAEHNALLNFKKYFKESELDLSECTLYCTSSPCLSCAKLIVESGIKNVVYLSEYRLVDGLKYLNENKVNYSLFGSKNISEVFFELDKKIVNEVSNRDNLVFSSFSNIKLGLIVSSESGDIFLKQYGKETKYGNLSYERDANGEIKSITCTVFEKEKHFLKGFDAWTIEYHLYSNLRSSDTIIIQTEKNRYFYKVEDLKHVKNSFLVKAMKFRNRNIRVVLPFSLASKVSLKGSRK